MKKNKILVLIEKLSDIEEYKKIGINNFLFAINDYSIGYNSFSIDEIKNLDCNKCLLINRIFNSDDCDSFRLIKDKFRSFNGIIFESIAVYNILKDTNINLIWNQSHFATNYLSINEWLNNTYSVVISNELTKEEISLILKKCNKPLILNIFGINTVMYSRRTLISNFNEYFNIENSNDKVILNEPITKNEFLATESKWGTLVFTNEAFNIIPYLDNFDDEKILFYYINTKEFSITDIINAINGKKINNTTNGFMNKKTIYKLGDKK